jgi:methionyl aminopeptidase
VITYKSRREIDKMRTAGQVIVEIFEVLEGLVRPGISTGEIDERVEDIIRRGGNRPSFKGYHGFPASICASINEEVVHGIPGDRILHEGDLLTVDVGVIHKGYHADAARSYAVGGVNADVDRLAAATADALDSGLAACRAGNLLSDIARAVESHGRRNNYGVVEEYVGHGIGTQLHEDPRVPNYVSPDLLRRDLVLKPGLVLAIEPMFNLGTARTRTLTDGWTVVTEDGRCSAHFEDTVAITDAGPEVLTRANGRNIWRRR